MDETTAARLSDLERRLAQLEMRETRLREFVAPAVWDVFEALPSQTRPQRGAKPAVRLTALAHELASDDILSGAGRLAHAEMHAALDTFQADNGAKITAKRQSVLVVDGKTVKANITAYQAYRCNKCGTVVRGNQTQIDTIKTREAR